MNNGIIKGDKVCINRRSPMWLAKSHVRTLECTVTHVEGGEVYILPDGCKNVFLVKFFEVDKI